MILGARRSYQDLFTWSHGLGDQIIAHRDGAVSAMIAWNGIDTSLMSERERAEAWEAVYRVLESLASGWCLEYHLWRTWDPTLAEEYRKEGQSSDRRSGAFGNFVRAEMAAHLSQFAMSNRVAAVLTATPPPRLPFRVKRALADQARRAERLLQQTEPLLAYLTGGRVTTIEEYCARITQTLEGIGAHSVCGRTIDPGFALNEQLVTGCSRIPPGAPCTTTRTFFVYLYPDASPGWSESIASLNLPLHICQVIRPLQRRRALAAGARQKSLIEGLIRGGRRDGQEQAARELDGFLEFVERHNLPVFHSVYVVQLCGSDAELERYGRELADLIDGAGGQVRCHPWLQRPYGRIVAPGQGYLSPVFRPDHLWQVGNMIPAQVFTTGDPNPECLRMGRSGALVGFRFSGKTVQHAFTIAITGGGKGVEKVVTIAETYPLGIDWYVIEVGESYRWVVEAFGGAYVQVDPGLTSVNPLPPYRLARTDAAQPVDTIVAAATVNALAFLLTDGCTVLTVHQAAAAQAALQRLYATRAPGDGAPSLSGYLTSLSEIRLEMAEQIQAARAMASNLESFLATAEGRVFSTGENLEITEGLCGIDLGLVEHASPKLLKFYLVFLSLRFGHMALGNRRPCRVLLDELHKFVAHAPEVVGRLVSELARMGRKESASIDLVTQGIHEIDAIDKEVLNAMAVKTLMYRSDQWDEIATRIGMPDGPLGAWRAFPYPLGQPWRPAIRGDEGRYFALHLTFPGSLLDLADTSPAMLDAKRRIGQRTKDPMERLRLLGIEREKLKS